MTSLMRLVGRRWPRNVFAAFSDTFSAVLPNRCGMDGFYVARLQKKAENENKS